MEGWKNGRVEEWKDGRMGRGEPGFTRLPGFIG